MTEKNKIIVGIKFTKVGKQYHFDASEYPDIKVGDSTIVETSRGWQLGEVMQVLSGGNLPEESGRKPIHRLATPRDLLLRQMWEQKEAAVVETCKTRVHELRIKAIKIVGAEYSFDGSHLTVLINSETDEKVDVKALRQSLQKQYAPAQVEIRQIGPRDVAKIICGLGACGLERRCCSLFLTEFCSISIRMAKEQGISLTPSEITGICGRLRCCLNYEHEHYTAVRKRLPKRNKTVKTPMGEGKVVDVLVLKESVMVELPQVGVREFRFDEIQTGGEGEKNSG